MDNNKRGAVIADMDGTVLKINSWHIFSKRLLWELLKDGKIRQTVFLISKQLQKKFGKIEHREVKYYFSRAAQKLDTQFITALIKELSTYKNPAVTRILNERKDAGDTLILTSAAAGEYALSLGKMLGFDYVHTTPRARESLEEYIENKGEVKMKRIKELLAKENLEAKAIFTDHWHDLPLLREFSAAKHYLVNPDRKTRELALTFPAHQGQRPPEILEE